MTGIVEMTDTQGTLVVSTGRTAKMGILRKTVATPLGLGEPLTHVGGHWVVAAQRTALRIVSWC